MQTKQDHVQAYRDASDRMGTALLAGEAHSGRPPLRRATTGALFGALIAALVCVVAYVYGLIVPGGNTTWQRPGTIVVEKETGNRYVLLDGTLRPTPNLASALLLVGNGAPPFVAVSRASLAGTPIGGPLGIPGAPDTMPGAGGFLPAMWWTCAGSGGTQPAEFMAMGPAGPAAVAPMRAPGDERVVLAGPDGLAVLWRGTVHPAGAPGVLSALGLGDVVALPVSAAWLAGAVTGPALAAPDIDGAGRQVATVAGSPARIGDVFAVPAGGTVGHLVVRADGLAPVSPTAAALLALRGPARTITAADVAAAPVSTDTSGLGDLPDLLTMPTLRMDPVSGTGGVCTSRTAAADGTVSAGPATMLTGALVPAEPVVVPPGGGLLVTPVPLVDGVARGPQFLITERGRRHPVSGQAAQVLARGATPVYLPPDVLAQLPAGAPLALPGGAAPPADLTTSTGTEQGGPDTAAAGATATGRGR